MAFMLGGRTSALMENEAKNVSKHSEDKVKRTTTNFYHYCHFTGTQ